MEGREPAQRSPTEQVYRVATRIFSLTILGFGVAILVVTLARGGGLLSMGVMLGLLFTALGAGRFYLTFRT